MTAFNTLFASNEGKQVSIADKATGTTKLFRVSKLSDKLGSLKNGEKASYVVLAAEDGSTTVVNLHPQAATALFKKGAEGGMKITEAAPKGWDKIEGGEEVNTEEKKEDIQVQEVSTALTVQQSAPEVNTVQDVLLLAMVNGTDVAKTEEMPEVIDGVIDVDAKLVVNENPDLVTDVQAIDKDTVAETAEVVEQKSDIVDVEAKEVNGATAETNQDGAESVDKKVLSKKERTIAIVHAGWDAGKERKDIIAQLRTELEMGVPGANTYYQNVKSGAWGGRKN